MRPVEIKHDFSFDQTLETKFPSTIFWVKIAARGQGKSSRLVSMWVVVEMWGQVPVIESDANDSLAPAAVTWRREQSIPTLHPLLRFIPCPSLLAVALTLIHGSRTIQQKCAIISYAWYYLRSSCFCTNSECGLCMEWGETSAIGKLITSKYDVFHVVLKNY